jgi:hypothetical protein
MRNKKEDYAICSLYLIQKLHTSPKEAVHDLLINAVDNYAKRIEVKLDNVLNDIIYDYYNNRLNTELKSKINSLVKEKCFESDKWQRGFDSVGNYDPVSERAQLIEACMHFPELKDDCISFYQLKRSMITLKIPGNLLTIVADVKRIKGELQLYQDQFGPDATFSVKIETLLKFQKDKKSNYDFELLAAFAAIKSIIGKKKYASTTKSYITTRMIGAKSTKELETSLKDPVIKQVYEKYEKRYHIDKLIDDLLMKNFISKHSIRFGRKSRLIVSTNLTNRELELVVIAIGSEQTRKKAAFFKEQQATSERIRRGIKSNSYNT